MEAVHKALCAVLRHPAAPKRDSVHSIRQSIQPENSIVRAFAKLSDHIRVENALRLCNTVQFCSLIHLFRCPSVGRYETNIKHILLIHKDLARCYHIRFCHQQANKQRRAKSDNGCKGYIPAK